MRAQKTPFDIRYRVVPCTAAEVLTFHSQRKELIPAIPGCVIGPVFVIGFKDVGPAFVLGGGAQIQVKYNNTAKTPVVTVPAIGFLDIATATSVYAATLGVAIASGNEANAADVAGKSLVSGTNGNVDYTSGGSPIVLVLAYRIIPITGFRFAALTDTGRPR